MADEIKKNIKRIRTEFGDLPIDYLSLDNLPKSDKTLSKSEWFADAKVTGDNIERIDNDISNLSGSLDETNLWISNHDHNPPVISVNGIAVTKEDGNVVVNTIYNSESNNYIAYPVLGGDNRTVSVRTKNEDTGEEFDLYYYDNSFDDTAETKVTGVQYRYADGEEENEIVATLYDDTVNKPPYPVTSVNGQTGDVQLTYLFNAELVVGGWEATGGNGSPPYVQTVYIDGIKSTDNPIADIDLSEATADVYEDYAESWQMIGMISTFDGYIEVYCYEYMPTINIIMRLTGVR